MVNPYYDLDIIDAGDVDIETHPSHKQLVFCGCYVGCMDCGMVGSTYTGQSKGIRTEECSSGYIQTKRKGEPLVERPKGKHPDF